MPDVKLEPPTIADGDPDWAAEFVECGSDAALARRRRILDAAREAFRAQGFHAASMASVAAGAHMSVGQIYRCFENKEALVEAIVEEQIAGALEELARLRTADGDIVDRLVAIFLRALRRHVESGFWTLQHEVRAEAARQPKLTALFAKKDAEATLRLAEAIRPSLPSGAAEAEAATRAERVQLIFEGALLKLVRRGSWDDAHVCDLIRPLLAAAIREPAPS